MGRVDVAQHSNPGDIQENITMRLRSGNDYAQPPARSTALDTAPAQRRTLATAESSTPQPPLLSLRKRRPPAGPGGTGSSDDATLPAQPPAQRPRIASPVLAGPTVESQRLFLRGDYRWTGHPDINEVVTPASAADQIMSGNMPVEHLSILARQFAYFSGERASPNLRPSDVVAVASQVHDHLDLGDTPHRRELDKVVEQVKRNFVRANEQAAIARDFHESYGDQYGR